MGNLYTFHEGCVDVPGAQIACYVKAFGPQCVVVVEGGKVGPDGGNQVVVNLFGNSVGEECFGPGGGVAPHFGDVFVPEYAAGVKVGQGVLMAVEYAVEAAVGVFSD